MAREEVFPSEKQKMTSGCKKGNYIANLEEMQALLCLKKKLDSLLLLNKDCQPWNPSLRLLVRSPGQLVGKMI